MTLSTAQRFCSHHQQWAKADTGEYVKFNSGKNHRWICKECSEKRKLRQSTTQ